VNAASIVVPSIVIPSIVNPAMPQSPIEWRNPQIANRQIDRQPSIIDRQWTGALRAR
jgi:hypothetical protein